MKVVEKCSQRTVVPVWLLYLWVNFVSFACEADCYTEREHHYVMDLKHQDGIVIIRHFNCVCAIYFRGNCQMQIL